MGWMLLAVKWFRKHKPVLTIIPHHLSGNPSWWPSHAWYAIWWYQPCARTDARKQVLAMCDPHVTVTGLNNCYISAPFPMFTFVAQVFISTLEISSSPFLGFVVLIVFGVVNPRSELSRESHWFSYESRYLLPKKMSLWPVYWNWTCNSCTVFMIHV